MPENAYPNAVCHKGHIECDHERVCIRCEKHLTAADKVAVHVTRDRANNANPDPRGIASVTDWGHADTGERP